MSCDPLPRMASPQGGLSRLSRVKPLGRRLASIKLAGKGLGSASRMVVEPGLQVARLCEIKQIFRQLLQLLQGQG